MLLRLLGSAHTAWGAALYGCLVVPACAHLHSSQMVVAISRSNRNLVHNLLNSAPRSALAAPQGMQHATAH